MGDAVMIGSTISHYRIVEKLGEGGMGVVYKAHDTKLDRPVALKFLPHYLTSDPAEKERFYHEARAASALLHPNVAVAFEIDERDGQVFIAMEYVEGPTLKRLAQEKTLTVKQALDIAIQVCDGLAAAHEKGIVHRDIKSENIIVSVKGQAKITDFGLAKVRGATKLTKAGSTLGTALYMSPEQARGEEVDHRSDIFSFGVVLYEMLTGRLPFGGEHEAALLYAIINDEPEPVARFNAKATTEIEHIVAKALEKERDDRYQHADEMLADLRRERKKLDYVKTGAAPAPAAAQKRRSRRGLFAGIGAAVAIVITGAALLLLSKQPPRAVLNPDMTFRTLPVSMSDIHTPGLSQDGSWTAFPAVDESGMCRIYFMNTSSGEARRVTADSSIWIDSSDISPDGSRIVYDRVNASLVSSEIAVVSSIGGSGKTIAERGWAPRWRPDGERIGYVSDKGSGSRSGYAEFRTVRPNGSDDRCEFVDSASVEARRFAWSPDGRSICWIRYFDQQHKEAFVYELSTREARQLTFDRKNIMDVCWAVNGWIAYSSNRSGNYNIWMAPAKGGEPVQITRGTGPDYDVRISRDGSKLLFRQEETIGHIWIVGTDGSNPRQITFDDAFLWRVSFSPDAKEVLFGFRPPASSKPGNYVCSIGRDGKNRRQLTLGDERVNNPMMSPDGRWIIYGRYPLSASSDSSMVYLIDARNPGTPRLVGKGIPWCWIDATTFLSSTSSPPGSFLNNIEGGEPRRFFEDSTQARPIQDGKYIAYHDSRSGREGIWICAAPGTKDPAVPAPRKWRTQIGYGEFDKKGEYYYWSQRAGELRRTSIPSETEETIRGVFPGLTSTNSWFDISYDGKEIVYTDARAVTRLIMIDRPFK